jgi:hypothetical protein
MHMTATLGRNASFIRDLTFLLAANRERVRSRLRETCRGRGVGHGTLLEAPNGWWLTAAREEGRKKPCR